MEEGFKIFSVFYPAPEREDKFMVPSRKVKPEKASIQGTPDLRFLLICAKGCL